MARTPPRHPSDNACTTGKSLRRCQRGAVEVPEGCLAGSTASDDVPGRVDRLRLSSDRSLMAWSDDVPGRANEKLQGNGQAGLA